MCAVKLSGDVHAFACGCAPQRSAPLHEASALQEKRPLLIVADGAEGLAGARALLEWEPCEAMATEAPVVLAYMATSGAAAPFAERADAWRERGMTVASLFVEDIDKADAGEAAGGGGAAAGHLAGVQLPAGEDYSGEDWCARHSPSLPGMACPWGRPSGGATEKGVWSAHGVCRKKVQMWDYFFRRPDIQSLFGGKWHRSAAVFSGLQPAEAKTVLANLTANGMQQGSILQR